MTPLLEMQDVRARRGALAIGPVSLRVAAGEVVALVGPNGAGKSSLLALATGELPAASGSCLLGGSEARALRRADVARRVALVRQGSPPRLALTAAEFVLHGRWVHLGGLRFPGEADHHAVGEALRRCGAAGLGDRDIRNLSGGEFQGLMLARALAQESPLLLLDEPTSHLDLAHRARALHLLRELVAPGDRGCLVVSHDLDLVGSLCDRVLVLHDGTVVAAGAPDEALRPDVLQAAFGLAVSVTPDPRTGRPRIAPWLGPDSVTERG